MNAITITQQNLATVDPGPALADFLRLNVADGGASAKTIASYLTEIRQFTAWCEAKGIDPARASEDDLRAYRAYLIATYARGTVATKLAAIRRFYDMVMWQRLRPDNPAKRVKAPADRTAREDAIKFLPLEGLKRLLALPDNARDRAILALMGYHGLRVSEITSLNGEDLDGNRELASLTVTGKGGKSRRVHLVEASAAALGDWLKLRRVLPNSEDEPAIFVSIGNRNRGRRLTARAVRYRVDGYLSQAGLKVEGVSCHSLRHSFATWSMAGGAKLSAISGAMGHSSITTTQVYAKIVDGIQENPARFLQTLIGA